MSNERPWNEWCDKMPEEHMTGCIEAEFVNQDRCLEYAIVRLHHIADERGSVWGHSAGSGASYKTHFPKYHRWRFVGPLVPVQESQGESIVVWSFYSAPGELRCLSNHGGDEDYIALLPHGMDAPSWMRSGSAFGCFSVSESEYGDGRRVFIGAHA